MSKYQALVQDIARLFVKYNLSDWRVVLDQLRSGGDDHIALAQAIENIYLQEKKGGGIKKPASRKSPGKTTSSYDQISNVNFNIDDIEPARVDVLRKLYAHFVERKSAHKVAELRGIYIASGGKGRFPIKRQDAIDVILRHVALLPEDEFRKYVSVLFEKGSGTGGEYAEWFSMIYKPSPKQ